MSDRAHKIMMPKELAMRPEFRRLEEAKGIVIKDAQQVVTLSPDRGRPLRGAEMRELGVQRDASVLVGGGRVQDIGEFHDLMRGRPVDEYEVIDASGKVVMPGLVDPHTHLVFAGNRADELSWKVEGASYLEIANRGGGIQRTVRETRAASKAVLKELASGRLDQMLLNGTTTLEAKSGYGLTTADEIKMLEVAADLDGSHSVDIVRTFLGAHALPQEFADDREGYITLLVEEMIPATAKGGLAQFCDVFCEDGYFSADESKRILEKGQTYGLRSKIHADEFTSSGGARVAADVGAITADHLLKTSEADMARMAESGVVAVLLPAVPVLSMEEGFANARRIIEKDIPVALATDFNPNCWTTSMQTVMSLACYRMRMTPEEVIAASTINAACALGRGDRIGSLDTGKVADILVLDVPDYTHIPYMLDQNCVETVIKNGRVVVA